MQRKGKKTPKPDAKVAKKGRKGKDSGSDA